MAKAIRRYSRKMLALVLAVSVFGFYASLVDTSSAVEVSSRYDAMNNSASSATSNHEFRFIIQNSLDTVGWDSTGSGNTASDTLTITFDADFAIGGVDCGDVDLLFENADTSTSISSGFTGGNRDSRTNCPGSTTSWGLFITGSVFTFYTPSSVTTYVTTGTRVTIRIGSSATNQDTGNEWVTNPAEAQAGQQSQNVGGTFGGDGTILVWTLSGVTVSATVAETLTFTITGLPGQTWGSTQPMAGCEVDSPYVTDDNDGETNLTVVTTTATTVPFSPNGTPITSGNVYQGCQRFEIATNAAGGYTVSQRSNTPLRVGTGATIPDTTCDIGPCTPYSAQEWLGNGAGFGVTCINSSTSADCSTTNPNFNSAGTVRWVPFAAESQNFASSTRFSVTTVAPWRAIHVKAKYRLQIPGTQAAGDYSNVVSWIATPTY